MLQNNPAEPLRIKRFCLPVTLRCNLRCRLCAEQAPYYKTPYHPSLAELTAQIDALFQTADGIGLFDLTGGEPLLRADLHLLIRYLRGQYGSRIEKLRLTTNGTLVPGGPLLESLRDWGERVYVIVDRYRVSAKAREAARALEGAGIPFEVREYSDNPHCDGWVDYGDLSQKHGPEAARALFSRCMVPKLDFFVCMVDGVLFPCARARLLYEQGIAADCLEIARPGQTAEARREALRAFLGRTALDSCAYCNGLCPDSRRFPPAEQLERAAIGKRGD